MTTETSPLQDFSICCDRGVEMTDERVLGISREHLGSPLHDGYISSKALKSYTLLNWKNFIKSGTFKRKNSRKNKSDCMHLSDVRRMLNFFLDRIVLNLTANTHTLFRTCSEYG